MSLALLQSALLLPVELLLQRLLALDPACTRRLAPLEGRTLALHCSQPQTSLYLSVANGTLRLGALHAGACAASLHGSAAAMLKLLLRRESVTSLHKAGLELRGDTGFVQELQALLLALDPDWEYQLSRVLGDLPARALGNTARQTSSWLANSSSRLKEDTVEFLHEESRLLPAAEELTNHYKAISDFRLRLDRLQARLALLTKDS
jgi:ubiquinone biosynthesis accessory factor UbiJ